MALKPRYKRRIFWACVAAVAMLIIGIVIIPPMISLNYMRPQIEAAIAEQTGVDATIKGDVHFSLLGRALIVAHNITVPLGKINSAMFAVPLSALTDFNNAKLDGNITIYGANLLVSKLEPQMFNYDIDIRNSRIQFLNKDYDILRGRIYDGKFSGIVRTDDHKYEIEFEDDVFTIHNHDNQVEITGQLFSDGSARGQINLDTKDVNKWFEFEYPRINQPVKFSADFEWDGAHGVTFRNIRANSFDGDIILMPNGNKDIRLAGKNIDFDFSFLIDPHKFFHHTNLDLDFYGNIKFLNKNFKHLIFNGALSPDEIEIQYLVADDINITGGRIDGNGAHDMMIEMPWNDGTITCLFSGTPDNWNCGEFTYNDMRGTISVTPNAFEIYVMSDKAAPQQADIVSATKRFGKRGRVNFAFVDMAGTIDINGDKSTTNFTFAKNKSLAQMGVKLDFLPADMTNMYGNFVYSEHGFEFVPIASNWVLETNNKSFNLSGKNFKDLIKDIDLRAINDLPYSISGTYDNGNISNLAVQIGNMEFTGTATKRNITLKTELLNLDSLISQNFLDNYDEMEFISPAPITIPFDIDANVSLFATTLIYNGNEYRNFAYTLKPNTQTFSITDDARGGILATMMRNKNKYQINAQLSRFNISGRLLNSEMPLNIGDTFVTGEVRLSTHGQIAHDITYNISGDIDLSFDGGKIYGLGIDGFYASAQNITTLNAEYALADAFGGGETVLKKMRIIGEYKNGTFTTTAPAQILMRHTDAIGDIEISNSEMTAALQLTMRGVAPTAPVISLNINPGGSRNYSLSQIMIDLDPAYLRQFVNTHDRF